MAVKSKKILSNFHLGILIVSLFAITGFILITSGLFDTPAVKSVGHTHTNQQPLNSSVNLNVINEINRLEDIVKKNPDNHETMLKLGHMLNDNGFYERAIEKYQTYLKVHPKNVDVIVDMGVCYFELKQYDKAIKVVKEALEINPKHQIANFNLGIINLANNNPAEARSWWEKAKAINPNTNIGKKADELIKSNN